MNLVRCHKISSVLCFCARHRLRVGRNAGRKKKKKTRRRRPCLKVDAASVGCGRERSVFPAVPRQANAPRCCASNVWCSVQAPGILQTRPGPRVAEARSRLAVIRRPVRQIVGRHGNNLVPSPREAGGPDGASVCLRDVVLFTATASSPSFPVGSNWKPRLGANSKKTHAAPFNIASTAPTRALPRRRQHHSGGLSKMSEGGLYRVDGTL